MKRQHQSDRDAQALSQPAILRNADMSLKSTALSAVDLKFLPNLRRVRQELQIQKPH
jgi:hypothetical protein